MINNEWLINDEWLYQHLEDEGLHYLTQHHPEDGVVGEFYFYTLPELKEYVEKYNIPVIIK